MKRSIEIKSVVAVGLIGIAGCLCGCSVVGTGVRALIDNRTAEHEFIEIVKIIFRQVEGGLLMRQKSILINLKLTFNGGKNESFILHNYFDYSGAGGGHRLR